MKWWQLVVVLIGVSGRGLGSAQEHAASTEPQPRQAGLRLSTGFGVGTRAFAVPTAQGVEQLDTSPFATTDVNVGFRFWPARRLGLDVLAAYQTSLAWALEQRPLFALPQKIEARSQRLELSVAPVVRFGDKPSAPTLAVPLGFGVRSFWPRPKQFPVHDFALAGPQIRVELRFVIARRLTLRLGPELQWLLLSSASLRNSGIEPASGLAIGAEAALEVHVDGAIALALAYRESRARIPTSTYPLEDTERYLSVRVVGKL